MASEELPKPSFPCPCCGYLTLSALSEFEICEVCFWEDDGQTDLDADAVGTFSGPNGSVSLAAARQNFLQFKACDRKMIGYVRDPRPEEIAGRHA